jgi:hypothetical protein
MRYEIHHGGTEKHGDHGEKNENRAIPPRDDLIINPILPLFFPPCPHPDLRASVVNPTIAVKE